MIRLKVLKKSLNLIKADKRGFFVFEPKIFNLIKSDEVMLEREPLEILSRENELMAFKHEGFWKCMDTKRDLETLNELADLSPPWFE